MEKALKIDKSYIIMKPLKVILSWITLILCAIFIIGGLFINYSYYSNVASALGESNNISFWRILYFTISAPLGITLLILSIVSLLIIIYSNNSK